MIGDWCGRKCKFRTTIVSSRSLTSSLVTRLPVEDTSAVEKKKDAALMSGTCFRMSQKGMVTELRVKEGRRQEGGLTVPGCEYM